MDSIAPECTPLKRDYEECFNRWFEEFLRGQTKPSINCDKLFRQYRECIDPKVQDKLDPKE